MSEVAPAVALLRTIQTLHQKGPQAKLELAHAADVPLGQVKEALDHLQRMRLVVPQGDLFVLQLTDNDAIFALVQEVILCLLEVLGPLPPKDLSLCVTDLLGEEVLGVGKVQGVAQAVANGKRTALRRTSVGGGGGSGRHGRDFYYLLKQSDELGLRLRLYDNARMRSQWRARILPTHQEGPAEGEVAAPTFEGPAEPFPTIAAFLDHLQKMPTYRGQMVHVRQLPQRSAQFAETPELHPALISAMHKGGTWPLYTHQAAALRLHREHHNFVVATPNASGKTLCYTLPIFTDLLADPSAHALYLTPTKALAQDQLQRLFAFWDHLGGRSSAATFDGDTTPESRKRILADFPKIILSNPDELHFGILPTHGKWAPFLSHLSVVVLDEMHIYQGVFGSHVSLVLRRLRRLCAHYGATPLFIGASATIANPGEFASTLAGVPFEVISDSGAPVGPKTLVLWNPPLDEEGARTSSYTEGVLLFKEHVKHHVTNLTFTKARRIAELVLRWAKADLSPELAEQVASYRAGYSPRERRALEQGILSGKLLGVTATNALELGIDIGGLDATILIGYPGTIASTWQQANRAGRGDKEALVTLIALSDPLDQSLMEDPERLFASAPERAVIDPRNPYLLADHLPCAAAELPVTTSEETLFGEGLTIHLEALATSDVLTRKRDGSFGCTAKAPHRRVAIRSTSRSRIKIVDVTRGRDREIGEVDRPRAFRETHPGAIYLHQGETYLVRELVLKARCAYVEPIEADYYTEAYQSTELEIIAPLEEARWPQLEVGFGDVEVVEQVRSYVMVRDSKEGPAVSQPEPLHLPATRLRTKGMWLRLGGGLRDALSATDRDFEGSLQALEHATSALLPLFAICGRHDLGGAAFSAHKALAGAPGLFLFDNAAGGVGLVEQGYLQLPALLSAVHRTIAACPCAKGCPSCVHSPFSRVRNEGLDKAGAAQLAALLVATLATPPERREHHERPIVAAEGTSSSEEPADEGAAPPTAPDASRGEP